MERLELAGVRDRLFLVPRTWADLRFVDHTIDPSERPVPACYQGDPRIANAGPTGHGSVCTIRSWLSMWSLETSEFRGETHLGALTMPALVIQATADSGVFSSDADRIYASMASDDKERVDVAGDHYFRRPCRGARHRGGRDRLLAPREVRMTTAAPGSSAAVARRGSGLPAGDASSAAARAEAAVPALRVLDPRPRRDGRILGPPQPRQRRAPRDRSVSAFTAPGEP